MRFAPAALLPLLLALGPAASGEDSRPVLGRHARVVARPLELDAADPARRRVGALVYLGGVRLTSPDRAFGGFSALQIVGDRFTLVGDGATVVRFRMGDDWRPFAAEFGDLAGPGAGWFKGERDSESMTRDPASGRTWIGFEQIGAIGRYDSSLARVDRLATPAATRGWPANGGPEAMARLSDGRFVLLSETGRGPGGIGRAGLVFAGDPTEPGRAPLGFVYLPPAGYDPTDMAELPGGRLLVLNRRLSLADFFTARLVVLDIAAIRRGARVSGREIATLAAPLAHENFEGLAVTREGGATIVWIVSDDNREWFQRSLLLKFRLEPGAY